MNFADWVQLITGPLILIGVLLLVRAQQKAFAAFRAALAAVSAEGEAKLAAARAAGCGCLHTNEVPY